jgi:hypothetical protein
MTTIPAETKNQLRQGAKFNVNDESWRKLNDGIVGLVKKAVGNKIADDQPYTFRINFQNGRIVGEAFDPRFSVEKLEGRTPTTEFTLKTDSDVTYYEAKNLGVSAFPRIFNGDSWVARFKLTSYTNVLEVFVNPDFEDPEDRKLIKEALLKGFAEREQM